MHLDLCDQSGNYHVDVGTSLGHPLLYIESKGLNTLTYMNLIGLQLD